MATHAAKTKLLHYPTPPAVCAWLASTLQVPARAFVLDPCCGTGEAVLSVAPKANIFGIELDMKRADAAATRLRQVICADALECVVWGGFGMVFLNPPYDDTVGERLEYKFLHIACRETAVGGVLVLIVPEKCHQDDDFRAALLGHFDEVCHFKFPAAESKFKQTLWIGRRRKNTRAYKSVGAKQTIADFPVPNAAIPVPPIPVPIGSMPSRFVAGYVPDEVILHSLGQSPIQRIPQITRLKVGTPPIPLRDGHIALLLASGWIDGVYGEGAKRHVARGSVVRRTQNEKILTTEGGKNVCIHRETETFEVVVRIIDGEGQIHTMGQFDNEAAANKKVLKEAGVDVQVAENPEAVLEQEEAHVVA